MAKDNAHRVKAGQRNGGLKRTSVFFGLNDKGNPGVFSHRPADGPAFTLSKVVAALRILLRNASEQFLEDHGERLPDCNPQSPVACAAWVRHFPTMHIAQIGDPYGSSKVKDSYGRTTGVTVSLQTLATAGQRYMDPKNKTMVAIHKAVQSGKMEDYFGPEIATAIHSLAVDIAGRCLAACGESTAYDPR